MVWYKLSHSYACGSTVVPAPFLERLLFPPLYAFGPNLVEKSIDSMGSFRSPLHLFHWSVYPYFSTILSWLSLLGGKLSNWKVLVHSFVPIFQDCFFLEKKRKKLKSLSPVWLFATPWAGVHQAPLSMEFSRQEYWSGLPFPSPRNPLKSHGL